MYHAEIEISDKDHYDFFESGMLGERIPVEVLNISLTYNGEEAPFEKTREGIRFSPGTYTLVFDREIKTNQIETQYDNPYSSIVVIPSGFHIGNPLLAVIRPSSHTIQEDNSTTTITWDDSRFIELKFYKEEQVQALFAFAQFWIIIAIVLLLPYYLTNASGALKPPEKE